jgi:hypothetical protein
MEDSMSETTGEPPPVDARYAEAVRKQREAREKLKQMPQRRAPILRLVWNRDEAEAESSAARPSSNMLTLQKTR